MTRLELQLTQKDFYPGDTLQGMLLVEVDKPLKTRGIRLAWQGLEETHITVSHGKHSYTYREKNLWASQAIGFRGEERLEAQGDQAEDELFARMSQPEPFLLPVGVLHYDFAFEIPPNAPLSFSGYHTSVSYKLNASLDLPLKRDVRANQEILVRAAPQEPSREPGASVSYPPAEGRPGLAKDLLAPLRPEMQMELRLDQPEIQPGGVLSGRVGFMNRSSRRVERVVLELRQVEYARAGKYERTTPAKVSASTEIPVGEAGELPIPVAFQLITPSEFTPDWEGVYSSLHHIVRARLDVAWAPDVWVEAAVRVM